MKAIVMAGGEGTRLRPVTEGLPKPMAEILGKPVLQWTVENLKRYGFTDICFTLRYMPERIENYFGSGEELGVSIRHSVERAPLGTAGSVRACMDFIGDEDVLVISGDAVCGFDLSAVMDYHRQKGAEATIVLYEHPEPTDFGLVISDSEGRVTSFSEKPDWERVVTDRVNTGIYVLSPSAVMEIPEDREYDFGRDLFPRLVREGRGVYALPMKGYWCDIGSPEAYRRCCVDMAAGKAGFDLGAEETSPGVHSSSPLRDVEVRPPVFVGEGCEIAPGVKLGPGAVIGPDSSICRGVVVENSVVNGAIVGEGSFVKGAIICHDAALGGNVTLEPGCVIGEGVKIGEECRVMGGVRVWPGRTVPRGTCLAKSITAETPAERAEFKKDWLITGTLGSSITPEAVLGLGAVLGRAGRVGAAYTGGERARMIADALLCGVTSAGGEGVRLDGDFEAELAFASKLFSLERAAFVRARGESMEITVFGPGGIAISGQERKKLESALTGESVTRVTRVGSISNIEGTARAYISGAAEELRAKRTGKSHPAAVTGSGAENRALKCVLAALGFEVAEFGRPSFAVSPGGFGFTAMDERGRQLDELHASAVTALAAMRLGESALAAPSWLPDAAVRLGERYGCEFVPLDSERGRTLYAKQRYFRDGAFAAAAVLTAMSRDGAELGRLFDDLPPFAVRKERVELNIPRAEAMRLMSEAHAELAAELAPGLTAGTWEGRVRLTPDRVTNTITLRAESSTAAQADSLLARYAGELRDLKGQ